MLQITQGVSKVNHHFFLFFFQFYLSFSWIKISLLLPTSLSPCSFPTTGCLCCAVLCHVFTPLLSASGRRPSPFRRHVQGKVVGSIGPTGFCFLLWVKSAFCDKFFLIHPASKAHFDPPGLATSAQLAVTKAGKLLRLIGS